MHEGCGGGRTIPGEVRPGTMLFFIGEAGGATEEWEGKPFVGRSGTRLKTLLRGLNVTREEVSLSNVYQHRPPGNRKPKKGELQACLSNVKSELIASGCTLIVTLGATAATALGLKVRLTKDHGFPVVHEIDGVTYTVVPWYHPAATLRSARVYVQAVKDAEEFWERVNAVGTTVEKNYRLATVEEGDEYVRGVPLFAIDLETTSPTRKGVFFTDEAEILGFSLSKADGDAVYIAGPPGPGVFAALEDVGVRKVCHNAKFEWKVLRRAGITMQNFEDTKGLAYLLQYPDTGLKSLARQVLGEVAIEWKELGVKGDAGDAAIYRENFTYGCMDADFTLRIWELLRLELAFEGPKMEALYREVELPLIPILARMESRGVNIDEGACNILGVEIAHEVEGSAARVRDFLGSGINVGSRDQLSDALMVLGAPIRSRTKGKGNLKTDEKTLLTVRQWNPPLIDAILRYFKFVKRRGFVEGFLSLRGDDGRIHPSINQFGHVEETSADGSPAPVTGRLSYSSPNVQQIPNEGRGNVTAEDAEWGKKIRRCLIPSTGRLWVSVDFAQQEVRIGAFLSGDAALLKDFNDEVDVYSVVATDLYGRHVTKDTAKHERYIGKQFFLAWLYGAGAKKVMELDPRFSAAAAARGLARLTKRYPEAARYAERMAEELLDKGFVETLFGRRRYIPEAYLADAKMRAEARRQASNTPIQGTAADILKVVMVQWSREGGLPGTEMIAVVHDEMCFEVETWVQIEDLVAALRRVVNRVIPNLSLPLEGSRGNSWGALTVAVVL